jgi:hypothetical protein
MDQNDIKWIMRKMLASAIGGTNTDNRVRSEILHCVFIIRDRALPQLVFDHGARSDLTTWTALRDEVAAEATTLEATFDGETFYYRPSVNRILDVLARAEDHPNGKAWWTSMKVDMVDIPGH